MQIYLVGGAIRDKLLHLPVKEKDYVVVGASPEQMLALGFQQVGKDFPVFLHPKTKAEYALARLERKIAAGYKGFTFDTNSNVSLEEDLARRDLTINAMAEDENGQLIDPYGGKKDLDEKKLRHVSPAFVEDPVRILRVARFAARYHSLGFEVAPETMDLMKTMVKSGEVNALVAERVWRELEKALSEKSPHIFFQVLSSCDALAILFTDVNNNEIAFSRFMHCAHYSPLPIFRFVGLFCHVEEKVIAHRIPKINSLCKRYRIPKMYEELTLLVSKHYEEALNAKNLNVEELLNFLLRLDTLRKKLRFENFLASCKMLAGFYKTDFATDYLKNAALVLAEVKIEPLLDENLNQEELIKRIKNERLKALTEHLQSNR